MSDDVTLRVEQIEALAGKALARAGASGVAAASLARAIAAAEADGLASHGLAYLATYCEHLAVGKVIGQATPKVERPAPGIITVDAGAGFAHPAIDAGFAELVPAAKTNGIAGLAVRNSYNCGVLGYHTEHLAALGLLALGFTNAPASIAASGGRKAALGTNPWSLAAPDGNGGAAIVIDQSASVVAKSEVMKRARRGETIPLGWAFAPDGKPTEDPDIALKGTMAPAGGYKGVGNALLVELMAACLTGAVLGIDASPFSGIIGGPPRTGQFFIAVQPQATSGGLFSMRLESLLQAMAQEPGTHIPGQGRRRHRERAHRSGVPIEAAVYQKILALAGQDTGT
jgi:(2R)-3-sulfolactate dehydrogenase (NADP+)